MDNDAYGHVNNVHYYSYFDTAVNGWLIESGLLAIAESPVIGLVVESGCSYFESVAFPDALEAGIAVAHLGRSSVRYRIGIFRQARRWRRRRGISSMSMWIASPSVRWRFRPRPGRRSAN